MKAKKTERSVEARPSSKESGGLPKSKSHVLPVVGVGASAGGLEALQKFFSNVPAASGVAFVVVIHLDPEHKSMMGELLARHTKLEVCQVNDGMRVEADCLYIIPAQKNIAIEDGVIRLFEVEAERGIRHPIDFFFRSLANEKKDAAVGVILSGNGSDGTLGIQEIKGEAGLVIVQEPKTAKFTGMPESAIATGMVDFILSPEEMAHRILDYLKFSGRKGTQVEHAIGAEPDGLKRVFTLLRNRVGVDFSLYKISTVRRRIERRMAVLQIDKLERYVQFLLKNPKELDSLFKDLLIGVTSFFRDPKEWEVVKEKIIPHLFKQLPSNEKLRVWVVGCSTGEEAFSIAMLLTEAMDGLERKVEFQIFASDVDEVAIEKARLATYPDSIASDVSSDRLTRFFTKFKNTYQVKKSLRDSVVFAVHDVNKDPPFSKIHLISCRNLLIYLTPEAQGRALQMFHYALNPEGILFLGTSENIGDRNDLYTPLGKEAKCFVRKGGVVLVRQAADLALNRGALRPTLPFPMGAENLPRAKRDAERERIKDIFLEECTPPAVLVREGGDILFIQGPTGKFLEPWRGEPRTNIASMAREGLKLEISAAIRKAITSNHSVR